MPTREAVRASIKAFTYDQIVENMYGALIMNKRFAVSG